LSVAVAAGVGIGYPISGLIAQGLGLAAAFWFGAAVSGLALLCVLAVVPSSANHPAAPLDVPGVMLLTTGLVALLLAIAQGTDWGWSSAAVIGLLVLAVATLGGWVAQQLHAPAPLVDLRLLRHPAVLTADACAIVLGVAMYMFMSSVTEYVQAPAVVGYGFAASVVVAGLCLVPLSVTSLAVSRTLPWLSAHLGRRALLPLGSLVVALAGGFFALFHTSLWQAFVMMALLGVGIGSTSAAIPGLLVRAVPESETGSVMGFYQVVRYIGFSLGSALTASILASHTPVGQHLPTERGYTLVFSIGAAICVAAASLAWFLPARSVARERLARDRRADEELFAEDAELGPTGFVGITAD
jgi:predicted MFS family arabinose efflux permease